MFNGRIELAYSSTFRVLAFSLLIGVLSPGSLAPAIAQDNKQPTPAATQASPVAAPQSNTAQQAPAATDQPTPVSNIVKQQRPVIDDLQQQTKRISDQLPKAASNDETLANLKLQLDSLSKKLLDAGVSFRPRLSEINTRLEQLGPAPSSDQPPEPAIVSEERARLTSEKAEINAIVGETEDTSLSVNQMSAKIGDMRRDLFARTLSQRVNIDTTLGTEVASAASSQMVSLWRIVQSWWRFVSTFKLNSFLAAAFFAFVAALVIQLGARRVLGTLYQRDPTVESPSYLSRLSVAFWSTVIPSAAVGVFLATTYFF